MNAEFGHWLAGFTDGEGSFTISQTATGKCRCAFRIALRADDVAILEAVQAELGAGTQENA